MIKLAEQTILLNSATQDETVFDADELKNRLRRCFAAAGFGEHGYLAEDIALAVEHSLRHAVGPERKFDAGTLDGVVLSVLRDTGFAEVATLFAARAGDVPGCASDIDSLEELLRGSLQLSASELHQLSCRTADALQLLKLPGASRALVLELAKNLLHPVAVPAPGAPKRRIDGLYYVHPETVAGAASPLLRGMFSCRILESSGVRKTFKGIRIAVDFSRFSELKNLSVPVTELELEPRLTELGAALAECVALTDKLYSEVNSADAVPLPVHLTVKSPDRFSGDYLGGVYPETQKTILYLVRCLCDCAGLPECRITCGVDRVEK